MKEKQVELRLSFGALRVVIQEVVNNKPFLLFLLAFLCSGFSVGMWYGLIYIYVDAYLGLGDQFAKMFLLAFIVGLLVTPLWYQLALGVGKKTTWLAAMVLLVGSYFYTGLLEPGETGFIHLLLLKICQTCGFVGFSVIPLAMLSEITDYSQLKSGVEKRATYFSIKVFIEKINIALGASLGLALSGWWGFEVTGGVDQTQSAVTGIKAAIAWIPATIGALSLIFIALNPINERRHQIIRRRLDALQARSESSQSQVDQLPQNQVLVPPNAQEQTT